MDPPALPSDRQSTRPAHKRIILVPIRGSSIAHQAAEPSHSQAYIKFFAWLPSAVTVGRGGAGEGVENASNKMARRKKKKSKFN